MRPHLDSFPFVLKPIPWIDRLIYRLCWLKQDLGYLCARWIGRPDLSPEYAIQSGAELRIWVIASGGIATLYTALSFLHGLTKEFPRLEVYMFVSPVQLRDVVQASGIRCRMICDVPESCPWPVRKALQRFSPTHVLAFSDGPSPSLLRLARSWKVPVAWLSAEMTEDWHIYSKPWRWRQFVHSFDLLCAASPQSQRNLIALGIPSERVLMSGSLKHDACEALPGQVQAASELLRALSVDSGRPLLVAASVAAGEEITVLEMFTELQNEFPNLFLVLAPRNPSTCQDDISQAVVRLQLNAFVHSSGQRFGSVDQDLDVLVLDTVTGLLKGIYALSQVVFVGRTLGPRRGSNVLEPACQGCAIVVGPNMQNFTEVQAEFLKHEAFVQVANAPQLRDAVARLLKDPELRGELGRRAKQLVAENRGVAERTLGLLNSRGFLQYWSQDSDLDHRSPGVHAPHRGQAARSNPVARPQTADHSDSGIPQP